jgi:hypothetical protein
MSTPGLSESGKIDDEAQDHAQLIRRSNPMLTRMNSMSYTDVGSLESLTVFLLQFLIWWSVWNIMDTIPMALGYQEIQSFEKAQMYLAETVIGTIIYFSPTPPLINRKLKRFLALVIFCCGFWGLLDSISEIVSDYIGINIIFNYFLIFSIAAIIGIIHHNIYRTNYLLDQLL